MPMPTPLRTTPGLFEPLSHPPMRSVFISDGTGITAETFGNAILAQFNLQSRHVRLPLSIRWTKPTTGTVRQNQPRRS